MGMYITCGWVNIACTLAIAAALMTMQSVVCSAFGMPSMWHRIGDCLGKIYQMMSVERLVVVMIVVVSFHFVVKFLFEAEETQGPHQSQEAEESQEAHQSQEAEECRSTSEVITTIFFFVFMLIMVIDSPSMYSDLVNTLVQRV